MGHTINNVINDLYALVEDREKTAAAREKEASAPKTDIGAGIAKLASLLRAVKRTNDISADDVEKEFNRWIR